MARKTWIKVKRGILEPKHIDALAQAWYLYFYILDNADWETGTIQEWKDDYAAQDLGKPIGMIREHRKHLANQKYITCEKKRYCQLITIHNWTDPRRYDGVVQNTNAESAILPELCEEDDFDQSSGQSNGQSSGQSSCQTFKSPSVNSLSSYSHIITYPHNQLTTTTPNVFAVYESEIGFITSHISEMLKSDIDDYTEAWVIDAIKLASENNARTMAYIEAILKRWKVEGKDSGRKPGKQSAPKESVSEYNTRIVKEIMDGKL